MAIWLSCSQIVIQFVNYVVVNEGYVAFFEKLMLKFFTRDISFCVNSSLFAVLKAM